MDAEMRGVARGSEAGLVRTMNAERVSLLRGWWTADAGWADLSVEVGAQLSVGSEVRVREAQCGSG